MTTAAAAVLACATACGPDTGGGATPITGTRIWVGDQPDKEVLLYDTTGALIKVVGGWGMFSKPNAIDIYSKDGSAWVCDFYTNRIRKFDASGNALYASPTNESGWLVLNPTMLSVSQSTGDCWVADRGNHRIIRLGADGTVLAKITGFNFPRGVSASPTTGDTWVADEQNDAVVRISGSASGEIDVGTVEMARYSKMSRPWAVAADNTGGCWVTNGIDGQVLRLDSQAGDPPAASLGGFDDTVDVALDITGGRAYVLDGGLGVLAAFPLDLTGNYGDFHEAAVFVISTLTDPTDVFVDETAGRIFVADTGSRTVRVFDGEGNEVTTITGLSGPAAVAAWSPPEE